MDHLEMAIAVARLTYGDFMTPFIRNRFMRILRKNPSGTIWKLPTLITRTFSREIFIGSRALALITCTYKITMRMVEVLVTANKQFDKGEWAIYSRLKNIVSRWEYPNSPVYQIWPIYKRTSIKLYLCRQSLKASTIQKELFLAITVDIYILFFTECGNGFPYMGLRAILGCCYNLITKLPIGILAWAGTNIEALGL